ncbi:DUF4239 domain-containing protein [bacterium]|nr:DUF4239 domain-containing protein [bacterium]
MTFLINASMIAIGLFLGMLLMLEWGRRIGVRMAKRPEPSPSGVGATEGAVFALLGLLIAFTFSGAAERFDKRRHLVVEEANMIGTAYLRIDLLPKEAQPDMRDLFRRYLNSRLESYRKLPDIDAAKAEFQRSVKYQNEIWKNAVAECNEADSAASCRLFLPALNEMIDITTTRLMAMQFHPPLIVYLMLIVLGLSASLFAGYGMAASKRSWIHIIGFSLVMAITLYAILDIEYPRFGLIRVDAIDQVLEDLLKSMK